MWNLFWGGEPFQDPYRLKIETITTQWKPHISASYFIVR